ncbi:MAG: Holliday junction resolvase RecU [Blautia sp.]|nr:Holliday junction resolvase RecU [Blautia sp.]
MATWNSRGLRGSTFEELINRTNEHYRETGLALIQKIPTPITPVRMDKENGHITLAYFEKQSTVDYIGAVQGVPVCFDAKECSIERFALANVHPHQVQFMKDFEQQGGVAFLLLFYSRLDLIYYLPLRTFLPFWQRMEEGGRKSFRRDELPEELILPKKHGVFVPYLDGIARDLSTRE